MDLKIRICGKYAIISHIIYLLLYYSDSYFLRSSAVNWTSPKLYITYWRNYLSPLVSEQSFYSELITVEKNVFSNDLLPPEIHVKVQIFTILYYFVCDIELLKACEISHILFQNMSRVLEISHILILISNICFKNMNRVLGISHILILISNICSKIWTEC